MYSGTGFLSPLLSPPSMGRKSDPELSIREMSLREPSEKKKPIRKGSAGNYPPRLTPHKPITLTNTGIL